MSDREPVPNLGANVALVDQQPDGDQFLANQSSGPSNTSLRRTDSMSSAASTDAAARGAPRRNWDRLTYGGFGGWFKRLFSSKKRAQHRREIDERRAAWSQLQEGMTDQNYVPDLSLLRSKWGGRKLRQLDADSARDAKAYRNMGQSAPDYLRAQQGNIAQMKFFQQHGVDDAQVDPGPSAARPAPQRGILKNVPKVDAPQATDHSIDQAISSMNEALSSKGADDDEEHNAWEELRALPKATPKAQQEQAEARFAGAQLRSSVHEDTMKQLATATTWKNQGDLAFPMRDVNPALTGSKRKVVAFHQGYWNAEQQAPVPTSKASHGRRVHFNMGDSETEHLLNTPGHMPDEGEVMGLDDEGAPAEGRILPTGAFQYPAADPDKMYSGTSAAYRTAFNRAMVEHPEHLTKHVLDKSSAFHSWAKDLFPILTRPSNSSRSRAKGPLDPAQAGPAEAKGADYHRRRDEGIRPEDDLS
jgi:hypothetical protein